MKRAKMKEPERLSVDEMLLKMLDPRPVGKRQMEPTQKEFIYDSSPVAGYMGRKGAAKTSSGAAAGWLRTLMTPGGKGVVMRKDGNDLETTTMKRFQEMLNRLPTGVLLDRSLKPPAIWYIQPVPMLHPDGTIWCDDPAIITFSGLEALEEGGSVEADWTLLDEASEAEERNYAATLGWMRNIPPWADSLAKLKNSGFYRSMLLFNPTDTFHWLYTACTGLDHTGRKVRDPWIKLFTPTKGENMRNLPADYYEVMARGMPEDQRIRLIEGQWGAFFEGEPCVPEFKMAIHVKDSLMEQYDPFQPLFRFLDFGYRHPYCLWAQMDWRGRLLHLREYLGKDIEIGPFCDLIHAKEKLWFPDHKGGFQDFGDPAARQKKDTGSTLTVLGQHGIQLRYKITTIEEGLQSMRVNMDKLVDGEPLFQYDRLNVPIIINALRGGYHRDDHGKPVKDGYYDHPVDANRYGIVNLCYERHASFSGVQPQRGRVRTR